MEEAQHRRSGPADAVPDPIPVFRMKPAMKKLPGRRLLRVAWLTLLGCFYCPCSLPAADLKGDEQVIFFPTQARPVKGGYELALHGWVFEPERRRLWTAALRRAVGLDDDELTPQERTTFAERSRFFVADNERRKTVRLQVGARRVKLAASAPNGHFTDRLRVTPEELGSLTPDGKGKDGPMTLTVLAEAGVRACPTHLQVLDDTGVSVISDIDDTIKVSEVLDKRVLLRNTFCRPFQAVPGMAMLYRGWAESAAARFHYVSASPWQLYPPLAEFLQASRFPAGSFHLRLLRLKDKTLLELLRSPEGYKLEAIGALLSRHPGRRFVLVGDSGEKDPEVYGQIARQYARQVRWILIRDVTGEPAGATRYQQAFRGVAEGCWRVFKEPAEIGDIAP
jgi:hypothetical protein